MALEKAGVGDWWTPGRSEAWTWKARLLVLPAPLGSFPLVLRRLIAEGPALCWWSWEPRGRATPSGWSGGLLERGPREGESVSLRHRNPPGIPASFSRPQFLFRSHSAPHPWLGVGPALQHCSESCFINRKILNTDLGIKQGGWLWAVVF